MKYKLLFLTIGFILTGCRDSDEIDTADVEKSMTSGYNAIYMFYTDNSIKGGTVKLNYDGAKITERQSDLFFYSDMGLFLLSLTDNISYSNNEINIVTTSQNGVVRGEKRILLDGARISRVINKNSGGYGHLTILL